jgi:hypothetical protein
MRSSWSRDESELDGYARGALFYEITTLAQQASVLLQRQSEGQPHTTETNALIEAALIHLRLLDDFLGSERQTQPAGTNPPDDVFARHWLPTWEPSGFLSAEERSGIHAQVAHLSSRRSAPGWTIGEMTQRCLNRFGEFLDQLRTESPTRASSFSPIVEEFSRGS